MGEYQSGEKEPAVLEGYFYPAQISWGAAPLPLKLFLSESWNQNAVSLEGWRLPLTHHNSSIGTSLSLDHFQAGPYPFSNAVLIPVGEACTTDGECKPQITDGITEAWMGTVSCFSRCAWESWDLNAGRDRSLLSSGWWILHEGYLLSEGKTAQICC